MCVYVCVYVCVCVCARARVCVCIRCNLSQDLSCAHDSLPCAISLPCLRPHAARRVLSACMCGSRTCACLHASTPAHLHLAQPWPRVRAYHMCGPLLLARRPLLLVRRALLPDTQASFGTFDTKCTRRIYIPLPDARARKRLLEIRMAKMDPPPAISDSEMEVLLFLLA